jgi:hypothetical protein
MKSSKPNPSVAKLEKRFRRLARSLAQTGLILQGSVNEVTPEPLRPGANPRGPYYVWTWKLKAKTHTVALSKAQVGTFQKAIANHRKLKKIIGQMRELSWQILETTTEGVKKRKLPKNQSDGA